MRFRLVAAQPAEQPAGRGGGVAASAFEAAVDAVAPAFQGPPLQFQPVAGAPRLGGPRGRIVRVEPARAERGAAEVLLLALDGAEAAVDLLALDLERRAPDRVVLAKGQGRLHPDEKQRHRRNQAWVPEARLTLLRAAVIVSARREERA